MIHKANLSTPMEVLPLPYSEDLIPYQVHSRREITALLRSLIAHQQPIHLHVSQSAEIVVTTILALDEDTDDVILDCAQSGLMNAFIISSDNLSFETALEHIRILFFSTRATDCMYADAPALKITLPTSLVRLQRREFYRVTASQENPGSCTITIPNGDIDAPRSVSMVLHNVSGGGIALIDEYEDLDDTIGKVYHNCRIDLPGSTLVIASLELRNTHEIHLPSGKPVRRLGCLFVNMPHAMMASVQRYIARLEREHNARAADRVV